MRLSASEMDMAHRPVRRRVFPPFVKHWIAGGSVVGMAMMTVLLLQDAPKQQDTDTTEQHVAVPPREELEAQKVGFQPKDMSFGQSSDVEEKQETLDAPKAQFVFYDLLPKMEVSIQENDPPARMKQVSTTAEPVEPMIAAPVETYYLQAGSFRDKGRADSLRTKLAGLGFKSEIHDISINNTDVYHRVSAGPFADSISLVTTKRKLAELGIETQKIKANK